MVPGIVRGTSTVNALQVPDGLFKLRAQGASDVLATIDSFRGYAQSGGFGNRYELWTVRAGVNFADSLGEVWRHQPPVHWLMEDPAQVPSAQSASKHLVKLEIGPPSPGFPGHAHWEVVASLTLKIGEPNGDFRTAGLYGYGAWIRDPNSQSDTEYKFAYVFDGNVGFPPQVHLQRVLMTGDPGRYQNVSDWMRTLTIPGNPGYFIETAALL
jgi:hypothetical protein